MLLYGLGFSLLFTCMARLDISRNAPVMNIEPVASLLGIVLLTWRRATPQAPQPPDKALHHARERSDP
ncbi:membrane protein [Pseudomonas syringae pv. actinidiae ICMP 19070]|nr:membrane protein [Pseudomonas syringae pv. actinidiae ICMP 19070]